MMLKKIYSILIIFFLSFSTSLSDETVYIITTVNDKIITNYDVKKESEYLKLLNQNLSKLNKKEINRISKESLINERIKDDEIRKFLDFSKDNPLVDVYIKDLYKRLNFTSINEFQNFLNKKSDIYSFNEIKDKINIEIMWNELVYMKYGNQVKIDKKKLLKKIESIQNEERTKYLLSEIVFGKRKNESIQLIVKKIETSISEIGFKNTANIYSISESSKLGGDIGWVSEHNLSELVFNSIKNLEPGQKTKPIQIGNNFLILKVEEKKYEKIPISKEEELKKMIKFETNKQLNQFSRIYFDKTKINYSINEN
tara:strand:+ start:479 stop:1414 length:936 start_codon:yes stop_codon:yes gene_type:complete